MKWWLPVVVVSVALIGCSSDNEPVSLGPEVAISATTAELDLLNDFRAQAGFTEEIATVDYLTLSSVRHAGYQADVDELTHFETDVSSPYYIANGISGRINVAATGFSGQWPSGVSIVYEDVATSGNRSAVELWWNSVYHRVPMMRHDLTGIGYGDRALARQLRPGVNLPSAGRAYGTMNFIGDAYATRSLSHWPADGQTGVYRAFDTDTESPDPLDGNRGGTDVNGAPDVGICGVPIHVIFPTGNAPFSSLSISLTSAGVQVEHVVLVGETVSGLAGANMTLFADSQLGLGELFILPLAPMPALTTYRVQISASDSSGTLPSLDWSFTTR